MQSDWLFKQWNPFHFQPLRLDKGLCFFGIGKKALSKSADAVFSYISAE